MECNISDVRKRLLSLNESQYINKAQINIKYAFNTAINNGNKALIENVIKNWRELDNNKDEAFGMVLSIFEKYCEVANEGEIIKTANYIAETEMPKVGDMSNAKSALKRYTERLKRKASKVKLSAKHHYEDSVEDTINANKPAETPAPNNVASGSATVDALANTPVKEAFNILYEAAEKYRVCDRVIGNHNKLSKRFNMDKLISDKLDKGLSIHNIVYETCALIDTYTIPTYAKFNIALENTLYILDKYKASYSKKQIVNAATDYFLYTKSFGESSNANGFIASAKKTIESNPFFMGLFDKDDDENKVKKNEVDYQFDYFFNNDDINFSSPLMSEKKEAEMDLMEESSAIAEEFITNEEFDDNILYELAEIDNESLDKNTDTDDMYQSFFDTDNKTFSTKIFDSKYKEAETELLSETKVDDTTFNKFFDTDDDTYASPVIEDDEIDDVMNEGATIKVLPLNEAKEIIMPRAKSAMKVMYSPDQIKTMLDSMEDGPVKNYVKEELEGLTTMNTNIEDSQAKTNPEDVDKKALENILNESNDIIGAYKAYQSMNFEKIINSNNNGHNAKAWTIETTYKEIKEGVEAAGGSITHDEIKNILMDAYFDDTKDPAQLRAALKMRLAYINDMEKIYADMLRTNYKLFGFTLKEANDLLKGSKDDPQSIIRIIKNAIDKHEDKFIYRRRCIDYRPIGGGVMYVASGNMQNLESYVRASHFINLGLKYDCIIFTHGDNGNKMSKEDRKNLTRDALTIEKSKDTDKVEKAVGRAMATGAKYTDDEGKRKEGVKGTWEIMPVYTMSGGPYSDMYDLVKQCIKEGHKNILLYSCNPGKHSINDDPAIKSASGVTITYATTTLLAESKEYDDPMYKELLEGKRYTLDLCNEYGIDYDDDVYLEECYNYIINNKEAINEGIGSAIWTGIKNIVNRIVGAIIHLFKGIWGLFQKVVNAIRDKIKAIKEKKKASKMNKNVNAKVITTDGVKDNTVKSTEDVEKVYTESSNRITQAMKSFQQKQSASVNRIKAFIDKKEKQSVKEGYVNITDKPIQNNTQAKVILPPNDLDDEMFNYHLDKMSKKNITPIQDEDAVSIQAALALKRMYINKGIDCNILKYYFENDNTKYVYLISAVRSGLIKKDNFNYTYTILGKDDKHLARVYAYYIYYSGNMKAVGSMDHFTFKLKPFKEEVSMDNLYDENKGFKYTNKFRHSNYTMDELMYTIESIHTNCDKKQILISFGETMDLFCHYFLYHSKVELGVIENAVNSYIDPIMEMNLNEKDINKLIGNLKAVTTNVDVTISNSTNENTTNRYKSYNEYISNIIDKIEDANSIVEEFNNEEDINVEEAMNLILMVENNIHYLQNTDLDVILDGMTKYMDKLSFDNIDSITKYTMENPEVIEPKKLKETFDNYCKTLRKSNSEISCSRYMLIDCLKENSYKLSKFKPVEESIDETNAIYNLYKKAEGLRLIESIISACEEANSGILNELSFTNSVKLAGEKLKKTMTKLRDKDKQISMNVDSAMNSLVKGVEKSLTNDNREAVIKGSILPSASKIIKTAIMTGLVAIVNPALAVIGLLGKIAISKKYKAKERQMILDEIEIELKMADKYLKVAEDKNDLQATKQLLTIQRSLERQRQRIKYKMKVDHQNVPNVKPSDYEDD